MQKTSIQIFQGIVPKPFQRYISYALKQVCNQYTSLIIPCVGRYTLPSVALDVGYSISQMRTSDISLFSSLIGYALTYRDPWLLGIKFHPPVEFLDNYIGTDKFSAAVLYAMKVGQYLGAKSYYMQQHAKEFLEDPVRYVDLYHESIEKYMARLAGLPYEIEDMFAEIDRHRNNPKACILINPPIYANGYTKMFAVNTVSWDSPDIKEFHPKLGNDEIVKRFEDSQALMIVYRYKTILPHENQYAVFGSEYSISRIDRLLCNRPEEISHSVSPRKVTTTKSSKYNMLPIDYQIKQDSIIRIEITKKEVALYYRDLLAHKLGASRSESYYLLLLDNQVFGVAGFHLQNINLRKSVGNRLASVSQVFGFTVPSIYRRLNKLLMLCITSTDFQTQLYNDNPSLIFKGDFGFQTTCLTDVPENKTNRGILKLIEREKMSNGRYRLNYYSEFHKRTYMDCLSIWVDKEASHKSS